MSLTLVGHYQQSPNTLKFEPKWRERLDPKHVEKLAIQLAAGQSLHVTTNVGGWVLKGRHSAAAYIMVMRGNPELGIEAQPRIKVPVIRVTGTSDEERVLELSSIVNQRQASVVEAGQAYKEMVELLTKRATGEGGKPSKRQVVAAVAEAARVSTRTVDRGIREATPEAERNPLKPRKAKAAPPIETRPMTDEDLRVVVPTAPDGQHPERQAASALNDCMRLLVELRAAQGRAMNQLHSLADHDMSEACDQLQKDQSTVDDMRRDYEGYVQTLLPF